MPSNRRDQPIDVWIARSLRRRYQAVVCESLPAELLALTDCAPAALAPVPKTEP